MANGPLSHNYVDFFSQLARTNTKPWFEANKARFLEQVKEPFESLVGELLSGAAVMDGIKPIPVPDSVFRIHRDTRFGLDKSPYKTYMAAVISPAGRKDLQVPGMYLRLGAGGVTVIGGLHELEPPMLLRIRRRIASHGGELRRLLKAAAFVRRFGGRLHGERNKVLTPELREAATREPLIANKQFYCQAEYPEAAITRPDLKAFLLGHYRAMRPVNAWLARGT